MKKVDMSSEAITRRLRQASQLRDLSLSLMKAKKAHDEKVAAAETAEREHKDQPDPNRATADDR